MDKYLQLLLKEVNTVIIPDLGALTVTDAEKGEFMFMPYLKHDDSKFATYIAEKEGVELVDAKNTLAKYVREITSALDKGEEYAIYQFGSFFKEDGDVAFKKWDKELFVAHTEPIVEIVEEQTPEIVENNIDSDAKIEEQTPEPVENNIEIEANVEEQKDPVLSNVENETESVLINTPEVQNEPNDELPAPELHVATTKEEEVEAVPVPSEPIMETKVQTIIEKEAIEKGREKMRQLKQKQETKPVKKKRKPVFWIFMILLVLLGTGGVLFGINYNEWKQHIPFLAEEKSTEADKPDHKQKMEETLGVDEPDETNEDVSSEEIEETSETEEIEVEKEPEIVTPPVRTSGSFHAIAGAFSSKENADRMAAKLKDQGYPAFVSQRGATYFVSMKQFSTREEANSGIQELKAAAAKVWVFEGNLD
jgi:cytoskeletal protein RodZ